MEIPTALSLRMEEEGKVWPPSSPASPFYPSKSEFPVAAGSIPSVCLSAEVHLYPHQTLQILMWSPETQISYHELSWQRVMNNVSLQAAHPEF